METKKKPLWKFPIEFFITGRTRMYTYWLAFITGIVVGIKW